MAGSPGSVRLIVKDESEDLALSHGCSPDVLMSRYLHERLVRRQGMSFKAFFPKLLDFTHKLLDDMFTRDPAEGHAVFEDHPDVASKGDAKLRIVRFPGTING